MFTNHGGVHGAGALRVTLFTCLLWLFVYSFYLFLLYLLSIDMHMVRGTTAWRTALGVFPLLLFLIVRELGLSAGRPGGDFSVLPRCLRLVARDRSYGGTGKTRQQGMKGSNEQGLVGA
jgi:hypothetical protein